MSSGVPPHAGMLLTDKPTGWTSHDVVAVLRKRFPKGTKVGHTGTLDPLATGLLVVLVGPCTKLQARLQGMDKTYSGAIRLGVRTDTGDVTGAVVEEKPVPSLSLSSIQSVLDGLHGEIAAPAPAYSAVKHEGRPLYAYARAGEDVPVKARTATVRSWKALEWNAPELSHRMLVSSGTYVRTLAEVLGAKLGCGGTVAALRRETVGPFRLEDARPLSEWREMPAQDLAACLAASLPALESALK